LNAKTETAFAQGLIVKAPRDNAPDYVIGSLSIRREEFIAWLQSRDGEWVNLDMKRGQSGKWYAAVNNWKPSQSGGQANRGGQKYGGRSAPQPAQTEDPDEAIPF